MTIAAAARALRAREVSSVELTRAAIAAAGRAGAALHTFVTMTGESALAAARAADEELARGVDRGPLHGVPVAWKDLFHIRGVRTTAGSRLYENFVADADAAVVERFAAAGAVSIGKTGLHEFAYGITSANPHYGAVRNPWNLDCIPGGSSGGSGAAVAAGIVAVAMGTDTGGSIRIPASFCGVVGLKPTYGRVSRYGVMPLSYGLDHVGPLARTVRDAAIAFQIMAGHDPRDGSTSRRPVENSVPPAGVTLRGLRVGIPTRFFYDRLQDDVRAAVRRAAALAASLGAELRDVDTPDMAGLNAVARIIQLAEASAVLEPHLRRRGCIGPDVRALIAQGLLVSATDYVNAQRLRRIFQREFAALFQQVDCLFMPTTPTTAPGCGQSQVEIGGTPEDTRLAATRLVRGWNAVGLPAISIPCGLDSRGLPIGLQIAGPAFGEAVILRAAAALEDAGLGCGTPPVFS